MDYSNEFTTQVYKKTEINYFIPSSIASDETKSFNVFVKKFVYM